MCRLVFAQAGVKYEDVRLSNEEWAKLKPSTPTGQLPLLEVDGKQVTGSVPIARFLAERFGLAGGNDFENAQVAGIIDYIEDFKEKLITVYLEKDKERQAKLLNMLVSDDIPKYWGNIAKMIEKNNSEAGWISGDKPTYADLSAYTAIEYAVKMYPNFFEEFPGVFKLKGAVETLPNITKWLKERPETDH